MGNDAKPTALEYVRGELERMCFARQNGGFTDEQARRYKALVKRESELIRELKTQT